MPSSFSRFADDRAGPGRHWWWTGLQMGRTVASAAELTSCPAPPQGEGSSWRSTGSVRVDEIPNCFFLKWSDTPRPRQSQIFSFHRHHGAFHRQFASASARGTCFGAAGTFAHFASACALTRVCHLQRCGTFFSYTPEVEVALIKALSPARVANPPLFPTTATSLPNASPIRA